jgi:ParB family transcriptional regulator, chromosome partitioning protein
MAVRREDVIESTRPVALATPQIGAADATGSIWVPLNRLKDSPKNMRQVPHTEAHIKTLAALIHATRQIYPLVVEPEVGESGEPTGAYLVTAGKGRRLAQLERVKLDQIPADQPIWCVLNAADEAREVSLADNVHEPMHPADEFAAFKALIDEGKSIEYVAARFGTTPQVVQRRLKLANVAPEFLEMFRKGDLEIDHMMAFALSDDHEHQRTAWSSIAKGNHVPSAHWLRQALIADELPLSSSLAKFVGAAYEKAGGPIRRDLFDPDDRGYIMDVALLTKLATEKLEKAVARLKKEGFAWVEARVSLDYSELQEFGRVASVFREPTEQEAKRLGEIDAERVELEKEIQTLGEGDERLPTVEERLAQLQEEGEALTEAREQPNPEQQKIAGAIASIDSSGKLRIERGLLRPEDKKRFARAAKAAEKAANGKGDAKERIHSAAHLRALTAHRTLALQATLAERPDVALIALTHRLITQTFTPFGRADSAAQITASHTAMEGYADDIRGSRAQKALAERQAALKARLPRKPEALFGWLLKQPHEDVLALLAFCVAVTVNAVQSNEGESPADALAVAANLDMRQWWTATARNYFSRVSKPSIVKAVSEAASPEATSAMRVMKKSAAAQLAEERTAGTGWLPAVLRTPRG